MWRSRGSWMRVLGCGLLLIPATWPPPDAKRETDATCSLTLGARSEASLRYRTRWFSAGEMAALRADPAKRAQWNDLMPLLLRADLTLPRALQAGTVLLPAGTHRLALSMSATGALEWAAQKDQRIEPLPVELLESGLELPYLCLSLVPADDGALALVFQWGPEAGRIVFREP